MAEKKDEELADLSDWMSKLPNHLHTQPLTNLAIPGSHDSFTYNLHKKNGVCKSTISPFLQKICRFPFIHSIIFNWSVAQQLDVLQQLAAGVRYFDIRIAARGNLKFGNGDRNGGNKHGGMNVEGDKIEGKYKKDGGMSEKEKEVFCVHGLYCSQTFFYLRQLQNFLVEHPKELVILDFNHCYDMLNSDHEAFTTQALHLFGSMVCPVKEPSSLSMEVMWEGGYQVIMVYGCCVHHEYLYSSSAVRSKWPEKTKASEVLAVLDAEWKRPVEGIFKVYQGVLTPSTPFVILHLKSTLKKALQKSGMLVDFVGWVKARKGDGKTRELIKNGGENGLGNKERVLHQFNVFLADFVEVGGFCGAVVALNQ